MKATHYGILVIQGVVATYRWQGHVYTVYFSGPVGCVCLGCLHKLTNYVGHLLSYTALSSMMVNGVKHLKEMAVELLKPSDRHVWG